MISDAYSPALLLGGFWVMLNRLQRRSAAVWLSLAVTVVWLLAFVPLALWWMVFFLFHRENLNEREVENLTSAWATILLVSPLFNLPLARRASSILVDPSPDGQRVQTKKAAWLYAGVLAVCGATWAADARVSAAITERRIEAREKGAQESLFREVDQMRAGSRSTGR